MIAHDLGALEAAANAAQAELPRDELQTGQMRPLPSDTLVLWDAVFTDLGALVAYVSTGPAMAEHIALANPAAILALVARVRALEAERERLRGALQAIVDAWERGDEFSHPVLRGHIRELRAALEEATGE